MRMQRPAFSVPGVLASVPDPMTLYINVPFCRSKCTFCDYVHEIPTSDLLAGAGHPLRQGYVDALCREIRVRGEQLSGPDRRPHVMYWGGGTASVLDERETERIFDALSDAFDLSGLVEATIECSPDSVDSSKLIFYRNLGFDRFSSGVQSFVDERLRGVGRRHSAMQARDVVRAAQAAGFEEVSIDIMCGFPDESPEELEHTMSQAIELETTHLSLYPFRPTPGTSLRKMIDVDKKDLYLSRQQMALRRGREMMHEAAFSEYALGYFGNPSPFAILFFEGNHNMVGMGSGAVSYYDGRCMTHHKGQIREYIADPTRYGTVVPVSSDGSVISMLRAGLSYFPGIDRRRWRRVAGVELDEVLERRLIAPIAEFLRTKGLVEDEVGIRLPRDRMGDALLNLNFQLLRPRQPQPTKGAPALIASAGSRSQPRNMSGSVDG